MAIPSVCLRMRKCYVDVNVQHGTYPFCLSFSRRNLNKMKGLLSVVVALVVFFARGIESFPSGAPIMACDTLTPIINQAGHARPPQTTAVPYMINLTPFNDSGTLEYNPGRTYTCKLISFLLFK